MDRNHISNLPATISVPVAGKILGLSRSTAYEAAARGDIPTFTIGRRLVVPTTKFLERFGLEDRSAS